MVTCYCAPTAIGVGVYGFIVLCNQDVVRAFAMAEAGMRPEQIRARFARRMARDWQEDDEE